MKATVMLDPDRRHHQVSRYLYAQFAEHLGRCIYEGIWVGPESSIPNDDGLRRDVVKALAALKLPALRWPGGCFADAYHWQDGIGPRDSRPVRNNLWWSALETNEFGTDEFMRLCAAIDTEPYVAVNLGSGTVQEALDWVEYCTGEQDTALTRMRAANGHPTPYTVPFWGIGNETWGCGGSMRPEYYADQYRNWASFLRKAVHPSSKLIACGSHPGVYEDWDTKFLDSLGEAVSTVDYLALHNYTSLESALGYTDEQYTQALENIGGMRGQIEHAIALCQEKSTVHHRIGVILDEWGLWARDADERELSQQSTMLDAVFTAASFHAFHTLPDLFMTNLAQTNNVLQALVLTEGPRMLRTPTYHVWEMFMPHRDGTLIECRADGVSASATVAVDGTVTLSVVNTSLDEAAELSIQGVRAGRVLTADDVRDHNTFDTPDRIASRPTESTTVPPHSVAVFTLG